MIAARRAGALGLAAAALLAIGGCGAQKAGAPAASLAPASMAPAPGDSHAQIEALDQQISDELARAHVAPPATASCAGPRCGEAMAQPFSTPLAPADDAACHPAASDRCTDVCTVSTSICGNQARICDLARQLAGDDWAANKCESARASCKAAHDSCCSCVL